MVFSNASYAYRVAIYTDQKNPKMAREVIEVFKSTYPFNTFDIDYEIIPVESSTLKCESDDKIKRLPTCDSTEVLKDAAKKGIDQAMIIKDGMQYGGSGGGIPITTTKSPARTLLHEYLHTLGFNDEYQFSAEESKVYCDTDTYHGANVANITPDPAGYESDLAARSKHMRQIPWGDFIEPNTPITNHKGTLLGTGKVGFSNAKTNDTRAPSLKGDPIGLYRGKRCNSATPPIITWQPGKEATIMEYTYAGLGAGEELLVAKILTKKGIRRKADAVDDIKVFNSNIRRAKPVDDDTSSGTAHAVFER